MQARPRQAAAAVTSAAGRLGGRRPCLDTCEYVAWYAVMASKATPPEVIRRLNQAVNQVLGEATTVGRLREVGAAPRHTTPEETLAVPRAERRDFGAIARAGKIEVE